MLCNFVVYSTVVLMKLTFPSATFYSEILYIRDNDLIVYETVKKGNILELDVEY